VRRLLTLLVALFLVPAGAVSAERTKWDTRVFAAVPSPGYPAYAYRHPNGRVYVGTYTNPSGDTQRSRVHEWSAAGQLLRSWTVPGQDLSVDHGVQVATSDAAGRLVLLEKSTGRILRLDVTTGRFSTYSRIRDLPLCSTGAAQCSPNLVDEKGIPNYAAWLPGGGLLVTDYGQAVIWRIPPGGGTARVWLRSPRLDGSEFGTAGIVYRPGRHDLLVSQQSTTTDGSIPTNGKLYLIPVQADGRAGALTTLWSSLPGELPDGFGLAASGHLYVAMAGLTAQLVELSATGAELDRFPDTPFTGDNGSSVPFDTPSCATVLGTRVVVANQSFTGDRTHQVVLDVEVGEPGAPVFVPRTAGRS
jgi:sugar lactone lactonase YvrE